MYRVKITPRTIGARSARKIRYCPENFTDIEAARRWINRNMQEVRADAWRKIGAVKCDVTPTENGLRLDVIPALRMVNGLSIEYRIMEM